MSRKINKTLLGLLDPEEETTTIVRNVGKYLSNDKSLYSKDLNPHQHTGGNTPREDTIWHTLLWKEQ
jgi:hypothetical protein